MCVRVRIGKREREKDKRDNSNVRVGIFEGAAARPVQRVLYLCVCLSDDSGLLPSVLMSEPLCSLQFPPCITSGRQIFDANCG